MKRRSVQVRELTHAAPQKRLCTSLGRHVSSHSPATFMVGWLGMNTLQVVFIRMQGTPLYKQDHAVASKDASPLHISGNG